MNVPLEAWDRLSVPGHSGPLTEALADFLISRRWYRDKTRSIRALTVEDAVAIPGTDTSILLTAVTYTEADPQIYLFAVAAARGEDVPGIETAHIEDIIARLEDDTGTQGVLYDAFVNAKFTGALLAAIRDEMTFPGRVGTVQATQTPALRRILSQGTTALEPKVSKAEQSNTSVIFGQSFILKVFRKLEAGVNPDIEMGLFLTERAFRYSPSIAGTLEYRGQRTPPLYLAILQEFIPNEGDAWKYTITSLADYFGSALHIPLRTPPELASYHPLTLMESGLPKEAPGIIGAYLQSAKLLGDRTARMHAALTGTNAGPDFAPEPMAEQARAELHQDLVFHAKTMLALLRQMRSGLRPQESEDAEKVLAIEEQILGRFEPLLNTPINSQRIRFHGDFHLGQVLYTGEDFKIIDYEGEPARSLGDRRRKGLAMRDVAGMIRSFQYAPYAALFSASPVLTPTADTLPVLLSYADFWTASVGAAYLQGYFDAAAGLSSVPSNRQERKLLLDIFLLQKALYEIGYELNNRPDWVSIPLRGILILLT
jgi:maltose alpha-D-glucosyltransferase/alpha-amylase